MKRDTIRRGHLLNDLITDAKQTYNAIDAILMRPDVKRLSAIAATPMFNVKF